MPRKDQNPQRRAELIGKVAAAFAELGYRRTTTAELARRCDVQEPILYRLWPDKPGSLPSRQWRRAGSGALEPRGK